MFEQPILTILIVAGSIVATLLMPWLLGVRYIPHRRVGIVEKLWSRRGSLSEGRIIACAGVQYQYPPLPVLTSMLTR